MRPCWVGHSGCWSLAGCNEPSVQHFHSNLSSTWSVARLGLPMQAMKFVPFRRKGI